jgi:hypothetical protein
MKGMLCGVIVAIALAGCTSMGGQPATDQATYDCGLTFCQAEAHASAMMSRHSSARRSVFAAHMRRCMDARGWPVKDEEQWPDASMFKKAVHTPTRSQGGVL